jgi:hypothetical protein
VFIVDGMTISSDNFSFELSIHGATLLVQRERLGHAMLGDGEIDRLVLSLCAELHGVAAEMKTALRNQRETPLEIGEQPPRT